jgi:tetratricopeptide (TPR) repeat protein
LCDDPVRLVRVDAAWHLRGERDRQSPSYGDLLDYLAATCDQPAGALRQAQVALDEQRLEDALAWSAKAAKWDATSAESHRIHALVLNTAGRRKEAIAELQKACELEPRNAQLPFLLALAYGEASQPEQAIMQLRKTVEIDPDFGRAWYNLGLALAGREDLAASAEALERAEKLLPQTSEVPYALATVYLRAGRIEQAKQAAERALALGHVPAAALLRQLSR